MASRTGGKFHEVHVSKSTVFVVKEKYKNFKQIGSGSYGVVCSATDTERNKSVAIKKVKDVFDDLVDAKRILREIKLLAHLGDHENVTSILDMFMGPSGKDDFKDLYIVFNLFECDLDRIITSTQKLSDDHYQYFIYQLLRGLRWVHSADVIHRDLKPANLLVNSNCDLAICDFGLARGDKGEEAEMTDYVQTRWYRAPELLCDNQKYGKKVDVWGAGLIFAELLSREPVLKGKDYYQQLQMIVSLVGKPCEEDMTHLQYASAKRAISKMSGRNRIREKFGKFTKDPLALDLLEKMLVFNPKKRYSVEQCLEHPFFKELHRDGDKPVCPGKFDASFEDGYKEEMPKKLLQRHMHEVRVAVEIMAAKRSTA